MLAGKDQDIQQERDRRLAEARQRRQQVRQAHREAPPTPPAVAPSAAVPRPAIDFAAVLQLLGVQTDGAKRAQFRRRCPLHGSTSATSRCFSAHLDRNLFDCFKCGRSGNALDLWAHATRQMSHDAAIDLCARLAIPLPILIRTRNKGEEPVAPSQPTHTMPRPES